MRSARVISMKVRCSARSTGHPHAGIHPVLRAILPRKSPYHIKVSSDLEERRPDAHRRGLSHNGKPGGRRKPIPQRRVLRPCLTAPRRHPRYLGSFVISFATSAATFSAKPPEATPCLCATNVLPLAHAVTASHNAVRTSTSRGRLPPPPRWFSMTEGHILCYHREGTTISRAARGRTAQFPDPTDASASGATPLQTNRDDGSRLGGRISSRQSGGNRREGTAARYTIGEGDR